MQVALLGPVEVRHDGAVVEIAGTRLRALLVRLALDAGRMVPTTRLIEAIWADAPPRDAPNALQSLVSRLRRLLGDAGLVQQSAAGYRLVVAPCDVDACRFADLAARGRDQLRAGDTTGAAATLRAALALWRGDLPEAGVDPGIAAGLSEQRLDVLGDRIEADLQLGRHADLVAELEALRAEHPLRERFAGQLMTALAGSGRHAEALTAYERVRTTLAEELGADPSPDLREKHVAVLRGAAAQPEAAAERPRSNLRSALTTFVGRADELARVEELLDACRLVTVLGPGGAGKTRLATEAAARRLRALPHGAWFVEFAPVTDPAEVAHTVLSSLGLREMELLERRTPRPPREARERLLDALRNRHCLLVLDNCEHLLDPVAQLADVLLAHCPEVQVLATSREPLGIVGEALAPLSSLATPPSGASPTEATAYAAVQLFADRAAAVRPGFAVDETTVGPVTEIVRRLDGLPLAIELAAARLRTLPVGEIAARLGDRFRLLTGGSRTALPRHRTLRAVVDWSWDLLTDEERLLAERIAVFPGGVSAASAAGVCGHGLAAADVGEVLTALVEKSLLQLGGDQPNDGPRYRMLETIREYGTDRLAERGELAEVRRAHAEFFAALVAELEPKLRTADQLPALRMLEAEYDNILAALRTLSDAADASGAVSLALGLTWYWTMTDRHGEAATWLAMVLDGPGEVDPVARLTAEAVHGMNSMAAVEFSAERGADPRKQMAETVEQLLSVDTAGYPLLAILRPVLLLFTGNAVRGREMLDAGAQHEDPWVQAMVRAFRARFAENSGDVEQVRADVDVSLRIFREIGDEWGAASVLPMLAQLRTYAGDLTGAVAALEEAQQLSRRFNATGLDDNLLISAQLTDLRIRLGEPVAARDAIAAAQRLAQRRGSPEMVAITLGMAASVERLFGDLPAARELQQRAEEHAADAAKRTFGAGHGVAIVSAGGAMIDLAAHDVDLAAERLAVAYRAGREAMDLPIAAHVAVAVGALAAELGRAHDAARLLGAAARLRGAADPTQPDLRRLTGALRTAIGESEYAAAWEAGWRCSPSEALALTDPATLTVAVDAADRR